MESKMAQALKLVNSPVAVVWTDRKPEDALQFAEGKWGCVVSMITAAAKGRNVVFDEKSYGCGGGAAGLCFKKYELGYIENFLSTGTPDKEGEFYKKTPELACQFIQSLPDITVPTKYVVLKPLENMTDEEEPKSVIFLVNPDQLSGLVFLANYDCPAGDKVTVFFGAGCHSTILQVVAQGQSEDPKALIGLFDPSARPHVEKNLLSFSMPYKLFLQMEDNVEGSFLTKKTWLDLSKRI